MKQFLLVAGFALLGMGLNAQVGVNTKTPQATLDVHYSTEWAKTNKVQGVIFPKMEETQRDQMQNVPEGTVIYNLTKKCIDFYDGATWACVSVDASTRKYMATKEATYRETFTRNNCAGNEEGSTYEVSKTERATATSNVSKADAESKAEAAALANAKAWVKANGQSEANRNAQCTARTYTSTQSNTYKETFTRNNCRSNEIAGTYEVSKTESATASSTVSQTDADKIAKAQAYTKALKWVKANGQEEANKNAQCTPRTYTSTQTASFSKDFTRNNCSSYEEGSTVTYTREATRTASSSLSQYDADRKARAAAEAEAQRLVLAGGQSHANATGSCKYTEHIAVCQRDTGRMLGRTLMFGDIIIMGYGQSAHYRYKTENTYCSVRTLNAWLAAEATRYTYNIYQCQNDRGIYKWVPVNNVKLCGAY